MVRFLKFTPKKEIYEKFEEFLSKLVWRETFGEKLYSLHNSMYSTEDGSLALFWCLNFGSVSNLLYRLVIILDLTFIKVLKKF